MFLFTVFACMFACIYSRHYRSFSFKFTLRSSSLSKRMPEFTRSPIHFLSFSASPQNVIADKDKSESIGGKNAVVLHPVESSLKKKTSNNSNGMQNGWLSGTACS